MSLIRTRCIQHQKTPRAHPAWVLTLLLVLVLGVSCTNQTTQPGATTGPTPAVAGDQPTRASSPTPAPPSAQSPPATPTLPPTTVAKQSPSTSPTTPVAATAAPAAPTATVTNKPSGPVQIGVRTIASGLDTPWQMAFAPDGRLFFTERPGRVRIVEGGNLRQTPLIELPAVETAEGGATGLAIDPNFPDDPYLYVMYSYRGSSGVQNRVVRLRLEGENAIEDAVLIQGIPGGNIHNGGRMRFGPDGLLYVTTGDAGESSLAQDPESLGGKILRIQKDGSIPADNPFPNSPVYSLGHRNPQGLDWQPGTGRLYATEHGPTGNDEVNLIIPGENYGWPEAVGQQHGPYVAPVAVFSPAIAPSGAAFYTHDAVPRWQGSFFFATLRGQHLHRLLFDPDNPLQVLEDERLYEDEFGRLRDVVQGPDGALYVATSNRDGRGQPRENDDRILRIGPM